MGARLINRISASESRVNAIKGKQKKKKVWKDIGR